MCIKSRSPGSDNVQDSSTWELGDLVAARYLQHCGRFDLIPSRCYSDLELIPLAYCGTSGIYAESVLVNEFAQEV